jgi:small subunit ribosomal protein S11e
MVFDFVGNVFCFSSKKSGKGKRPGKGGNRFWKSVGLGFKTPREAIEGLLAFSDLPFVLSISFCLWAN